MVSIPSHRPPLEPPLAHPSVFVFLSPSVFLFFLAFATISSAQPSSKTYAPLTHANQIRQLTAEQASQGYPVRIRGVITEDVPSPDFFVQDSTAGIYVEGSHSPVFEHHLGDLVEIEGVTGPGKFAPVIREQTFRVLGRGTLPKGKLYSLSDLADGQLDSQWVQVRGIVRSAAIDRTSWQETTLALRVTSGSGEFAARVPIQQEQDFSSWVGREVLIEGVCGSLFTSQRQLSGILFYVPRLSFIKMEAPEREMPFSALLQFAPGEGARHRVRVRGVVAFQQLGNALFLQSEGKGLRVLTQQNTPLQPGDVVEVFGSPAVGESAPVLSDAIFHQIGHSAVSAPVSFNFDLPWEQYDGALVMTDATLLDHQHQNGGLRLLLRAGEYLFEATAPPPMDERFLSIPLNSQVRITGICLVRSGGLWSVPQSFRILLRSPDDVVVLRAPSWWNFRHAMWLLGITASVLLIVLAWVVILGGRLRKQMAIIRQKLRSGAVLEERSRIARELHDTLEQELAGITMQLDLASDCFDQVPRVAREAVETARRMSRHSMVEARRSVWDLRCHLLENGDLVSALTEIVKSLAPQDKVEMSVKISGTPVRLPAPVEMNLLRIGQEAVANAVKHGGSQHITIELQYAPESVRLFVKDDGCGFAPEEALSAGHFGLLDMRERAQSIGCHLQIESASGRGTRRTVKAPINGQRLPDEEPKADTYSGR
jgi:signal transduction histidine kinase